MVNLVGVVISWKISHLHLVIKMVVFWGLLRAWGKENQWGNSVGTPLLGVRVVFFLLFWVVFENKSGSLFLAGRKKGVLDSEVSLGGGGCTRFWVRLQAKQIMAVTQSGCVCVSHFSFLPFHFCGRDNFNFLSLLICGVQMDSHSRRQVVGWLAL